MTKKKNRTTTFKRQVPGGKLRALLAYYETNVRTDEALKVSSGSTSRWLNGKTGMTSTTKAKIVTHYDRLVTEEKIVKPKRTSPKKSTALTRPQVRLPRGAGGRDAFTRVTTTSDLANTLERLEEKLNLVLVGMGLADVVED